MRSGLLPKTRNTSRLWPVSAPWCASNISVRSGRVAVLVNQGTHLVDDAAHDARVADATEVGAGQLDTLFELLAGVVARMSHEHHVGIQRLGDVVVQLVGKGLLVGRHQASITTTSAPLLFTCSSKRATISSSRMSVLLEVIMFSA